MIVTVKVIRKECETMVPRSIHRAASPGEGFDFKELRKESWSLGRYLSRTDFPERLAGLFETDLRLPSLPARNLY